MIHFASETARLCFHELSVDEQIRWQKTADEFNSVGKDVTVIYVYVWAKDQSEVSIRIDKKIDVGI